MKFLPKKGCFLSFERLKYNFVTFVPPCEKLFGYTWNIHYWPLLGKNPSDAHVLSVTSVLQCDQCAECDQCA